MKRISRKSVIGAVCLLLISLSLLVGEPRRAEGGVGRVDLRAGSSVIDPNSETSRILAAIESRTDDRRLIATAKAKLLQMDEKQTGLLAVLSDRVNTDETSIGSSIAFLLITVLIALS